MELFYFTLPAPNPEKSKVFYEKILRSKVGGGSQGGNVHNETTPWGLAPSNKETHETMIYLTTFDLDRSITRVKECGGGKVLSQHDFNNVGRCAFCQDNQGFHFALQEPCKETREHAENPKKAKSHGDLFFFSIPCKDEAKGREFYNKVAGWKFDADKGAQGGLGITNTKGPDGGLGCGREESYASIWFRVDDCKQTCQDIVQAGGKSGEVFDAPEGTMSECLDDQGVKFGIVEPAPMYR